MTYKMKVAKFLQRASRCILFLAVVSCTQQTPASLAEVPSSEIVYNGAQVHYKICAPTQIKTAMASSEQPQPIVYVHGWGCDLNAWLEQYPYFAAKTQQVFIDLPGFGFSDKPIDVEYTLDYLAGAVVAVLEKTEISEPMLVGHSLGTAVCREVVLKYGGGLPQAEQADANFRLGPRTRLVDIDGVYCFYPPENTPEYDEYNAAVQSFAHSFTPEKFDTTVSEFLSTLFIESTPEAVHEYATAVMTSTEQHVGNSVMVNLIDKKYWDGTVITCPTLAVWSINSMVPEHYENILKPLYSDLTWHEFTNTGHFIMMEDPQTMNSLLEKHLALNLDSPTQ